VITLSALEEDDMEEQLLSELLICCRWCEKMTKNDILGPTRKVDGSRFFGPILTKFIDFGVYSDLWKNRPHKKHCAWAPTPPWDFQ
jgi:myo-inositol catabolism protein IolC